MPLERVKSIIIRGTGRRSGISAALPYDPIIGWSGRICELLRPPGRRFRSHKNVKRERK